MNDTSYAPVAEAAVLVHRCDHSARNSRFVRSWSESLPFTSSTRAGTVRESHQEVGAELLHAALEEQLEAQVVVLDPGGHAGVAVEREGLARLPGAVEDAEVHVRMLGRRAGSGRVLQGSMSPVGA